MLSGKVAVVTGASQGLGERLACELAGNGAAVALAARNPQRLEAVQGSIQARGGTATAVPTDLRRESDCRALVERVHETLGPVDLSPRIQKLATRVRPFTPGLIDRRIYDRTRAMRAAFTDGVADYRKAQAGL